MLNKPPTRTGKKDFFSMELNDKSPMPQGKFKGQPMENVPYWHLLWLDGKPGRPKVYRRKPGRFGIGKKAG
jgi:hypothetical protein